MLGWRKSRSIVLIRHAMPVVDPGIPPDQWRLPVGEQVACEELAKDLSRFNLREIVSSREPKAVGTARVLADRLGVRGRVVPGLHEHERDAMRWHGDHEWQALLREFFRRPGELVFGRETAEQALSRYRRAVDGVMRGSGAADTVIVSHGTVMALYIAEQTGADPFEIWRNLQLPDVCVLPVAS